MNQKVKVTMYSPNHEGLGGLEYIVTGLQFNEGRVTVQTTSGPLDTTIDELAREGRSFVFTINMLWAGAKAEFEKVKPELEQDKHDIAAFKESTELVQTMIQAKGKEDGREKDGTNRD